MKAHEITLRLIIGALAAILVLQGRQISGDVMRNSTEPGQDDQSNTEVQLQIQLEKKVLVLNEPCLLELSVRNLSSVPVYIQSTYPERDYKFDLKDERGESVPLTAMGKHLVENTSIYKNVGVKLGAQDHFDESIDLTAMYNFSRPGNYTVKVRRWGWREDKSEFEIVSKPLRFRVAAPAK